MNKIIIANDEITLKQVDKTLKLQTDKKCEFLNVKLITIDILENTNLIIEHSNTKETKFEININIKDNVNFNLFELKQSGNYKMNYNYEVGQNSLVKILKIHNTDKIKEQTKISLNGINSKITHILKTISVDEEKYDFLVYHNAKNTYSNIINNGVNIRNGILTLNLSSFAPKGIIECNLNQNSRIINLTNNKCQINPNLFIDENDVIANHSALIGTFSMEEMFYLMSRGISKSKAENLMIKGFLLNESDIYQKELEKIINKYWR